MNRSSKLPNTLESYLQLPLQDPCERAGTTSVTMALTKLNDAEKSYETRGYRCLPELYEYRPNLFTTAYKQLHKAFAEELEAEPNVECRVAYDTSIDQGEAFKIFLETSTGDLPEAQTRKFIEKIIVEPVICALKQLLQRRLVSQGHKTTINVRHESTDGRSDMSFHDLGGNVLSIVEVKKSTRRSYIRVIKDLCEDVPNGKLIYTIDDARHENWARVVLAKAVVNMVLTPSKTAIITDYHEWCFVALEETVTSSSNLSSSLKEPQPLLISDVYTYNTKDIKVMGTLGAIILDSYKPAEFFSLQLETNA